VVKLNLGEKIPVLTGIFVTLCVFPPLMDPINISKLWILTIGAGISLYFLIITNSIKSILQSNKLLFSILGTLVSFFILSATLSSQNLLSSLIGMWGRNNGLLCYLAFISLLISLTAVKKIEIAKYVINSLTLLGIIFGIYAWLQYFKLDILQKLFPWYNVKSVIGLTLGNSNFASVFLGITFTATLGFILYNSYSNLIKIVAFVSLAIQWSLVPYIDTQGKIIYAIGGALVVGIWLHNSENSFRRRISYLWWAMTFFVGASGIFGLFGFGLFAEMLSNNVVNLRDRYYHWVAAVNMIKENPLFGVGIDSFGDFHRRYRLAESIEFRGTPITGTDNAHNIFLQLGATSGLPLLLSYVTLILLITWRGFIALRISHNKVIVGTLLTIWLSYQVQSLISIDQIGLGVWNWIVGGTLYGLSHKESSDQSLMGNLDLEKTSLIVSKQKNLKSKGFLLILIIPSLMVTPYLINENRIFSDFQSLGKSKSQSEASIFANSLFEQSLQSNQPKLRITVADILGKSGAIELALNLADQTTEDFPNYLAAWDIVATIYESNGRKDLAIPYRQKTIELDPLNDIFKSRLLEDLESIQSK
jgi:O-antigen ligase